MYTSGADLGGGWRGSRTPSPLKMTCGFLIQPVFWQKKLLVYWCWSKTRDEVGEFMLNALKMVVCLNSAVSFNMYSQQFTLCWCEVYEIIFTFTLCYCLVKSLQKPSSWYSLLKFVYVTSQLHHSFVVHPSVKSPESAPATVCSFKGTVSRNWSNFKQWELPMFVTFEIILERYLFHTKLWFCHSQVIS